MKLALVLTLAVALSGCAQSHVVGPDQVEQARRTTEAAIAGTWRLTSYNPDQPLTGVLLMGLQRDRLVVTFGQGRMKSATPEFTFDRKYRVEPPITDTFKLWLSDDQGLEYESWARFDGPNRVLFECKTEPWRGSGTLDRVAPR